MKKHTKNYMEFFGLGEQDVVLCTVCSRNSNDLHHVHIKGMGGRMTYQYKGDTMDINGVENIIALCRGCHVDAHGGKLSVEYLYKLQQNRILNHKQ